MAGETGDGDRDFARDVAAAHPLRITIEMGLELYRLFDGIIKDRRANRARTWRPSWPTPGATASRWG